MKQLTNPKTVSIGEVCLICKKIKNQDRDLTNLYNKAAILRDEYMRNLDFRKLEDVIEMESIINQLKGDISPANQIVYY